MLSACELLGRINRYEEYGLTSKIIGGVDEERSKIVAAKIEISGTQVFNLQLGRLTDNLSKFKDYENLMRFRI